MKRLLCLLLCVLMVLPTLVACTPDEEELPALDLANCRIVKSAKLSSVTTEWLGNCINAIAEIGGAAPKSVLDSAAGDDEIVEIIVGDTQREESAAALSKLTGYGYVISVTGNKIVVAGNTGAFTSMALRHFVEKVLVADNLNGTVLALEGDIVVDNCEVVNITNGKNFAYRFIYDQTVDNDPALNGIEGNVEEAANGSMDYLAGAFTEMVEGLTAKLGLDESSVEIFSDATTSSKREILYGHTNRPESKKALEGVNPDQYVVRILNGRLVVNGWNDQAVGIAGNKLFDILHDCLVTDASGKKTVIFPVDMVFVGNFSKGWKVDFPKPEGITCIGTVDAADNNVEYVYQGEGVSEAAFNSYITKLTSAGYTKYFENEIAGSKFCTLKNTTTETMLHVTYAKFAHNYERTDIKTNQKETIEFPQTIRVVSAPLVEEQLPQTTPDLSYKKITDTMITQMTPDYVNKMFGNSYITTLEDGSFVIYDGGSSGTRNIEGSTYSANDSMRLYHLLLDLRKMVAKDDKITIAAWVMSHAHWDHAYNFREFCQNYGKYPNVYVEKAIANFPSTWEVYNAYNPGYESQSYLYTCQSSVNGPMTYVKVHTGQRIWVRNLEIEVLYTHEDMYPDTIKYFNDSSTTYRFTYHVTNGDGKLKSDDNKALTCIWLGDLYKYGSRVMTAMYGNTLKADMVQLAHHGANGCELELYKLISPKVIWWPTDENTFKNQTRSASHNNWWYRVNYQMRRLSGVNYILVADGNNYTVKITSNNGASSANFAKMYNASTAAPTSGNKTYSWNTTSKYTPL